MATVAILIFRQVRKWELGRGEKGGGISTELIGTSLSRSLRHNCHKLRLHLQLHVHVDLPTILVLWIGSSFIVCQCTDPSML